MLKKNSIKEYIIIGTVLFLVVSGQLSPAGASLISIREPIDSLTPESVVPNISDDSKALYVSKSASEPNYFLHRRLPKDECVKLLRYFYANGETDRVLITQSPSSKNAIKCIKNGEIFRIQCEHYYDGEYWGFVNFQIWIPSTIIGWVPMNQVFLKYDSDSFIKDHNAELYSYTGSYEELMKTKQVIIWRWPGSGSYIVKDIVDREIEDLGFSYAYKDNEGREWSRINSGSWICVSDPNNSNIPAFEPTRPRNWPDDTDIPRSMFEKLFPVLAGIDVEEKVGPDIFVSNNRIYIADITERNRNEIITITNLNFRGIKNLDRIPLGNPIHKPRKRHGSVISNVVTLWNMLYEEIAEAANPERYKIPYAFAFKLTLEEHIICENQPDEVLNVIQGKEAILTWITPEIQWGYKLRTQYLQDYIRILKENGHTEWAEVVESREFRK